MTDLWGWGAYALFSDLEKNYHTQMSRLNGGLLIDTIQKDMDRILNITSNLNDDENGGNDQTAHKIRVYSAHDTTLTALMAAMDNFNFLQPPYASCLIFELYEDQSIKLFYRNDTSKDVEPYQLEICQGKDPNNQKDPFYCTLSQWKYESTDLRVDNIDQFHVECGTKNIPISNDDKKLLYTIVLLLATWMGIALNICFKVFYRGGQNQETGNYTEFGNDVHVMDETPTGSLSGSPQTRSRANTDSGNGLFAFRNNNEQINEEEQNSLLNA